MSETRRKELTAILEKDQLPGEHIGLANVNKRLKLSYDNESGIIVKSKENCYSKFKLIMGKLKET